MKEQSNKYSNYLNAIEQLNRGIAIFNNENDLLRDGLIQRFEFTFELSWKTLKSCFEDEGLIGLNSPKSILREAFSASLIDNEELWLEMLNDRNSITHIYNEKVAIEICNKIIAKYVNAFEVLALKIKERYF